jgi:hypothetical protein
MIQSVLVLFLLMDQDLDSLNFLYFDTDCLGALPSVVPGHGLPELPTLIQSVLVYFLLIDLDMDSLLYLP